MDLNISVSDNIHHLITFVNILTKRENTLLTVNALGLAFNAIV
jgi:hypothetical protein